MFSRLNVQKAIRSSVLAALVSGNVLGAATDFSKGHNRFAMDLFARVSPSSSGNLFFSPYSIDMALLMTLSGARNATASEMRSVLHVPGGDLFDREMDSVQKTLLDQKTPVLFRSANALWGQVGFVPQEDYRTRVRQFFRGELEALDFRHRPRESADRINRWAADKTMGKITRLIDSTMISPDTRVILTNAVYFKGPWETPFDRYGTRREEFQVSARQRKSVPMMHTDGPFRYAESPEAQALELPYAGGRFSMLVLLPKASDLSAFEKGLTEASLTKWTEALRTEKVEVSLPSFRFESIHRLSGNLSSMGMRAAFLPSADFSGMTGEKNVFLSEVIHQAVVEVTEEGTEAAAATAVAAITGMMAGSPTLFRADHPFLFFIRDHETGLILFMGRVVDPAVAGS